MTGHEELIARFIPATTARPIGHSIFFRPVRSWHSATYAGEHLEIVGNDRSGCAQKSGYGWTCSAPLTVTHRLYWHESDPANTISAFLSYPGAMGFSEEYFWEALLPDADDVTRYFGDNAETEMEAAIIASLKARTAQ